MMRIAALFSLSILLLGCQRAAEETRQNAPAERPTMMQPADMSDERDIADEQDEGSEPVEPEVEEPKSRCDERYEQVELALKERDDSCERDEECVCTQGGVVGCGVVTNQTSAQRINRAIEGYFSEQGCRTQVRCAPQRCETQCVNGRCRRPLELR
jgi:hypothetical protein